MSSVSASDLKDEGNTHFASRRFANAARLYEEAEKTDIGNAIYPSNLSAALYELGNYAGSYQAILRSVKLLSANPNPKLAAKLSSRLPKALSHGLRDGTIMPKDYCEEETILKQLRDAAFGDSEGAWHEWERISGEYDSVVERARSARANFASLPMARKSAHSGLEYFCVGHDHPMSISSDWGPRTKGSSFNICTLSTERLSRLSYFWGGGGDARHVLASIIGFRKDYVKMTPEKRDATNVHFTLLDIHPTVLARDLCLFMMVEELIALRERAHDELEEVEIKATLLYIWMGAIIPSYCHVRFLKLVRSLLRDLSTSSFQPPHWLHVTEDSIPGIIVSLKFWLTQLSRETVQEMIHHHCDRPVENPFSFQGVPSEFRVEDKWYGITQCFVPPDTLRVRHEAFSALWTSLSQLPPEGLKQKVNRHINATWKPNSSLFNAFDEGDFGYPDVEFRPFQMVEQIKNFNNRMGLFKGRKIKNDCPAYSVTEVFFDAVVDSLIALKGRVCIELLQGDMCQELTKMAFNVDNRPANFPRKFTRMWLSNVPDYTHGPMNIAAFTLPNLEQQSDASVAFNCLLNTGIWEGGDHFIYNYTLLKSKDFARFFGCRVMADNTWNDMELSAKPLPRPLSELATRQELIMWLTRVLISTILPPRPPNPSVVLSGRIRYPNNLAAFFGLLMRLRAIGYLTHWVSEFLNDIVTDKLVTDIVPYCDDVPNGIHPSTLEKWRGPCRRVNLDPWQVELETMIALSYEATPFPTTGSLRQDDIGTYEASLSPNEFGPATLMGMFGNHDPVFNLVFYKCGTKVANMIQRMDLGAMKEIFEIGHGKGEIHVLTSLDEFGYKKRKVRWRMGRKELRR
ncbi:uncharacterized protein EV420DRAFT_124965 [Desarmillaria tabescens]|uniref:DUF4470 domain-containing protein n=1 Tax=Armillaria tabescens TaxID=1929756 RepID=A0AA39N9W8_ARMTA|nr:uncharacterized protein EV420DRAFT_124965 [Desarmillaria tabescens]KAK0461720.1 hypothetical protein EV420DRAFT_124965 [Desarmillaria tabescens]